jgi:hypothetical protein
MPSPFPGMDPYLEGSLWMSVHTTLAVEIARQLNRQLLPRYIALSTRRIYPIPLGQPLPVVPVPLLPGDADSQLDLQQALTVVYDECGLNYMIDYKNPPEIPFAPEQATWVDEYLRAAGLRP